ncbi:MAG: hypothetical protein SCM57_13320, partial [Bacillota bacterium]|nr:hypothetical protein [Bacillota bacterium]
MDVLKQFCRKAQEKGLPFYLVGGFLRDSLTGRASADLDLSGPPGALSFAADFCRKNQLKGYLISRHRLMRLQLSGLSLDISEFKGNNLTEDLAMRDFSLNAMALPLADYLAAGVQVDKLVDPLGGFIDLSQRTLRALPGALERDPLRVLRGARMAVLFGLTPAKETITEARKTAILLSAVPGERILAEIFAVLQGNASGYLPLLESLGAVQPVFGRRLTIQSDFVTQQTETILNNS